MLVLAERQGIEIDYCPRCRGVWLARGELDKLIDRDEPVLAAGGGRKRDWDDDDDRQRSPGPKRKKKGFRAASRGACVTLSGARVAGRATRPGRGRSVAELEHLRQEATVGPWPWPARPG